MLNDRSNIMVVGEQEKTEKRLTELVKERMYDGESILLAGQMKDIYSRIREPAEKYGYRMVCLDPETGGHDSVDLFKTVRTGDSRKAQPVTAAADIFSCCMMTELFIGQQETGINETAYLHAQLLCVQAIKNGMDVEGLYRLATGRQEPGFLFPGKTPPWRQEDITGEVRDAAMKKLPEKVRRMLSTDGYDIRDFGMEKTVCCVSGFKMVPCLAEYILLAAENGTVKYTVVMDETGCIMEPAEREPGTGCGIIMRLGTDDIPEAGALRQLCPITYYCI